LASALLSGVVVGAILIVVGKAFNEVATQGQANAGMQASDTPGPSHDVSQGVPERAVPEQGDTENEPAVLTGTGSANFSFSGHAKGMVRLPARRFRVIYEDWQRDVSRVDALQIRLRVVEGDIYFQFVTVIVPAPELRRLVGADPDVSQGRLWWHIAKRAEPQITDAIRRAEIPKTNPTLAYEVQLVNLDSAVRAARHDTVHDVSPVEPNEELLIRQQLNQILGYDSIRIWAPRDAGDYEVVLSRTLTDAEWEAVQSLADEYDFSMSLLCGEERWDVGLTGG
jgi:hypothetical protein